MFVFRRHELFAAMDVCFQTTIRRPGWWGAGLLACLLVTPSALGQTGLPVPSSAAPSPSAISPSAPPASISQVSLVPVAEALADAPGVNPDQDGDRLFSVHGLPATQVGETVDGASTVLGFTGVSVGAGRDPAPDPDGDGDSAELTTGPAAGLARGRHAGAAYGFARAAVREVRVLPESYSAASGGLGGVVATSSRSGSDRFHGLAFFDLRSSALAARNPLSVASSYVDGVVTTLAVKPHDLRENFGGRIGGPVSRRKRLDFLYAFDEQRRGFPAISSPADPDFYSLTAVQKALLANRGVRLAQVNAGLNYVSSLTGLAERRADQTIHFGRLDWRARPTVLVGAQYNRLRWTSPGGLMDAPMVARGRASLGNSNGSLDDVLVRVDVGFRGNLNNEILFEYGRSLQFETPQTPLAQEPGIGPGGLAPEVNIGPNGLLFGTPASLSKAAAPDERRFVVADTLTLSRGRHLLIFGASVALMHDEVATLPNAAGTFHYDSGTTGGHAGGLVDFITDYTFNVNANPNGGCPAITAATHLFCFRTYSQGFGGESVGFSTADWAGFIDETWKVRPGLALHAGARYDYTLLPLPQRPNGPLDGVFGTRGATSVFPEDRNNVGPRASVTWEPLGAGRGTLRAGAGVFYGRVPGATVQAALSDTAQKGATTRIRMTPAGSVACPQVPGNGFGYPCSFGVEPSGAVAATASAVVFDRRFRLPAIGQGSLSFERGFARDSSLTVGYVVNLDRQLPTSSDINIAPSSRSEVFRLQGGMGVAGVRDGEAFSLPVYGSRISPAYGPVTRIASSANGSYHALTVAVASRAWEAMQVRGSYTWSKTIDYGPSLSATPRTSGQLDPFANGYDKGLSTLNYPWSAHLAGVWTPLGHRGGGWLEGWEVRPVVVARAGRPYSLDLFGGTRLAGGHASLNGSGGALYLPTVGRNTLRLPPTLRVDLAVGRGFRVGGGARLHVGVEATNVTNHRQVSAVSERAYLVGTAIGGVTPLVFQNAGTIAGEGLGSVPFGTPTATGTSLSRERQILFKGRVEF